MTLVLKLEQTRIKRVTHPSSFVRQTWMIPQILSIFVEKKCAWLLDDIIGWKVDFCWDQIIVETCCQKLMRQSVTYLGWIQGVTWIRLANGLKLCNNNNNAVPGHIHVENQIFRPSVILIIHIVLRLLLLLHGSLEYFGWFWFVYNNSKLYNWPLSLATNFQYSCASLMLLISLCGPCM